MPSEILLPLLSRFFRTVYQSLSIRDALVLLIIVVFSVFLRSHSIYLAEFKDDEALLLAKAQELLEGRGIPHVFEKSSLGVSHGPLPVYLVAALYWLLGSSVYNGFLLVIFLNVIAVLLMYELGRELYNRNVGLICSLLYGVTPWGVVFSRELWNPSFLPPFLVLVAIVLHRAVRAPKLRSFAVVGILIGLLSQVTAHWLLFLPVVVSYLIAWRIALKHIAVTILSFVVGSFPYILHFQNEVLSLVMRTLSALVSTTHSTMTSYQLLDMIYHATEDRIYNFLENVKNFDYVAVNGGLGLDKLAFGYVGDSLQALRVKDVLFIVGFTYLVALTLTKIRKRDYDPRLKSDTLLILWTCLTLLSLFAVPFSPPHYFVVVLPASSIIIANLLDTLGRSLTRTPGHTVTLVAQSFLRLKPKRPVRYA